MSDLDALGRHVRERRESLGLSIRQAASDAGVTRATWNDVEQGRRSQVRSNTLDRIDRGLRQAVGTSATMLGQSIGDVPGKERRVTLVIEVKHGEVVEDTNAREQLARYATTATAYDVHRVLTYIDRLPPPPDVDEYVREAVARAIADVLAEVQPDVNGHPTTPRKRSAQHRKVV